MFPQSKVQKLKLLRKNKNVSNNILFTSGSDVEDSAIRKNTQDYLPIHQFPQISQRNKTERESVARISGQYCETEQSQIPTQQSPINQPQSTRSNNFRKKAISNHQATHLNQKSPRILFSSVKKGHSPRALINPLNHLVSNSPKLGQFNLFITKEYVEPKQFMKKYDLNQEEWERFGCRFPSNYSREKLLGRGGFSLIWLGKHVTTGQVYAVKQLPKKSKHETHLKELTFCNAFFNKGGQQKHLHDGSQYLCRMMDFVIEQKDIFIFYEVCGVSLGSLLYDFQIINEQTYKLVPQSLSLLFKQNQNQMYQFLKKLALIIDLLSKQGWVHCDIKSENILIKQSGQDIDLKLIDYGSSFKFEEVFEKFSMATPEYMCPELLNFILKENRMQYDIGLLRFIEDYNDPWAIDIWSLGCILLEIIHGLPLWMSYNTEVMSASGMKMTQHGLFAVRGRQFGKIIEKQIKVVTNLDGVILNYNFSGIKIDSHIMKMLKGMLQINPKKRLSPTQLLSLINMKSNEG